MSEFWRLLAGLGNRLGRRFLMFDRFGLLAALEIGAQRSGQLFG
jgi:hypothetical protein